MPIQNVFEYRPNLVIKITGIAALIAGLFLIILGPAEIICFPWYMEGGKFHYEGFGFGSLVYAVIAGQVIVYPLIGAILAAIGYGHIKGYSWSINLVRGLALLWLIVGLPLMPILLFLTLSFKALSGPGVALLVLMAVIIYPIVPLLVRRLYHAEWLSRSFTHTLQAKADGMPFSLQNQHVISRPIPSPLVGEGQGEGELRQYSSSTSIAVSGEATIVKVGLLIITGLVLVGAFLFRGLMPVFGIWLHGTMGMIITIIFLIINSILLVLNLRQSRWAQKANLGYTLYWLITTVITSITFDWHTILSLTSFASTEKQAMLNVPIQGIHIALAVLPPLIAILQLRKTSRPKQ